MRRTRRIKYLNYSKLLRAKLLKLTYVFTNRALRKDKYSNRIINNGLLKIGSKLTKLQIHYAKPSFLFTVGTVNRLVASLVPEMYLARSTDSSPKYLPIPNITWILGNINKINAANILYKNLPGLKLLAYVNKKNINFNVYGLLLKKVIYDTNYTIYSTTTFKLSYLTSRLLPRLTSILIYKKLINIMLLFYN